MFIKICGIQTKKEANLCIKLGVTALGFLLLTTHRAEDAITPEKAKVIIDTITPGLPVETIMVTHCQDEDKIKEIALYTGVKTIQIHDNLPIEGMVKLRENLPNIRLINAVHVTDSQQEALERDLFLEQYSDALLLDSRTKDRLGGTGQTHDWRISKKIVETVKIP